MESAMIGKIEKSKRYAEEPERIEIEALTVKFKGEHNVYRVTYDRGQWHCQCRFFGTHGVCSHTMALERIYGPRLAGGDSEDGQA